MMGPVAENKRMNHTISAREIYHAVRRGLTTARKFPERPPLAEYWQISRHGAYEAQDTLVHRARKALREHLGAPVNLPRGLGPRAEKALAAVVYARREPPEQSLEQRFEAHLARLILAEAERRGLPTDLDLAKAGSAQLRFIDRFMSDGRLVVLIGADGWAEYSKRVGRYRRALRLLGGVDDAGTWCVRVPGNIGSASYALAWLKPAVVRRAEADGLRVLRQGDVWIVEGRGRDRMDTIALPDAHRWDSETRMLHHEGHAPVAVPFPAIAIPQSTLAASGVGRRRGD